MRGLLCLLFVLSLQPGSSDKAALKKQREAAREAMAAALAAAEAEAKLLAQKAAESKAAADLKAFRLEKHATDKKAADEVRQDSRQKGLRYGAFSNSRSSPTKHETVLYFIKPVMAPKKPRTPKSVELCLAVPPSDASTAYRNGQAVILQRCNTSDTSQLFSFDVYSQWLHPGGNDQFCLDFDFDSKDIRPLTVFRCEKTFSNSAAPRHQQWGFTNQSNIKNAGTGKCIATGEQAYDGKAVHR